MEATVMIEWFYSHANLDQYDNHQIDLVVQATARLFEKLSNFDLSSLAISDYNKKYFGNYIQTLQATLQRYSYLLLLSINNATVPLKDFVFLDYGAGSGILALLAKELNIGTVIYNDIYEVSCQDAQIIAKAIGNEANYYIKGDIDDVAATLQKKSLFCDAIASYDVIEHIYDVDYFMQSLPTILKTQGKIVMETTANPLNPLINWQRMKIQKVYEHQDRVAKYGHKQIDTLKSYFSARKEIITQYTNKLKREEAELLAKKTRGLTQQDIIACVKKYLDKQELPQELVHPTNTCDPYTGNWAEHLIKPKHWEILLNNLKFTTTILGGYYSFNKTSIQGKIKKILNLLISLFQQKIIALSSSYIVYATKQ